MAIAGYAVFGVVTYRGGKLLRKPRTMGLPGSPGPAARHRPESTYDIVIWRDSPIATVPIAIAQHFRTESDSPRWRPCSVNRLFRMQARLQIPTLARSHSMTHTIASLGTRALARAPRCVSCPTCQTPRHTTHAESSPPSRRAPLIGVYAASHVRGVRQRQSRTRSPAALLSYAQHVPHGCL